MSETANGEFHGLQTAGDFMGELVREVVAMEATMFLPGGDVAPGEAILAEGDQGIRKLFSLVTHYKREMLRQAADVAFLYGADRDTAKEEIEVIKRKTDLLEAWMWAAIWSFLPNQGRGITKIGLRRNDKRLVIVKAKQDVDDPFVALLRHIAGE